jgi:hypothetical protein
VARPARALPDAAQLDALMAAALPDRGVRGLLDVRAALVERAMIRVPATFAAQALAAMPTLQIGVLRPGRARLAAADGRAATGRVGVRTGLTA